MYGAVALGGAIAYGIFGSRKRKERKQQEAMAQAAAAASHMAIGWSPVGISQNATAQGYAAGVAANAAPGSFLDSFSSALSQIAGGREATAMFDDRGMLPAQVAVTPEQEQALIQQQQGPSGVVIAVVGATVVLGFGAIVFALFGGKKSRR